jgi:hypothetical protein
MPPGVALVDELAIREEHDVARHAQVAGQHAGGGKACAACECAIKNHAPEPAVDLLLHWAPPVEWYHRRTSKWLH